eukprot:gene24671-29590_t
MRDRTTAGSASRRSTPSTRMLPDTGENTVLLPAPEGPTMATVSP